MAPVMRRHGMAYYLFVPVFWLLKIAFRFASGYPMSGKPTTDADWFIRGVAPVAGVQRVSRWAYQPYAVRAVIRVVTTAIVLFTWYSSMRWPEQTRTVFIDASVLAVLALAVVGRRRWRTRRFRGVYINPLARVLRSPALLNIPEHTPTSRWLTVSPDLADLTAKLVKPMSPFEAHTRMWYGTHVEPIMRWVPEHLMRGYWRAEAKTAPFLANFRRPTEAKPPRVEIRAKSVRQ